MEPGIVGTSRETCPFGKRLWCVPRRIPELASQNHCTEGAVVQDLSQNHQFDRWVESLINSEVAQVRLFVGPRRPPRTVAFRTTNAVEVRVSRAPWLCCTYRTRQRAGLVFSGPSPNCRVPRMNRK